MAIDRVILRNATSTYWASKNPVLAKGEVGLETNTRKAKFGDGHTAWNSLSYAFPASGETGIMLKSAYDTDGDGRVNLAVDSDTIDGEHAAAFAASGHAHTGSNITITDAGGYFPTNDTESALQDCGGFLRTNTGYSMCYPHGIQTTSTLTLASAGRVYCKAWIPEKDMTISGIAILVATQAAGHRVGIYSNTAGTGAPSGLLAESIAISCGPTTAVQEIAISPNVSVRGGTLYWLAVQSSGTTSVLQRGPAQLTVGGVYGGWYFANTGGFGAFEATRTSVLTSSTAPTLIPTIVSVP